MANLRCGDYGYDCDYTIDDSIENIVYDYWQHMNNEHGIDYPKGRIVEIIKKKKINKPTTVENLANSTT